MPQAPLKKKATVKPARGKLAGVTKNQGGGLKKGGRTIAPKKGEKLRQHNVSKKITSGLIDKTEKMLAARAGHLEVLKGGKNDKKDEKKNAATAKANQAPPQKA